MLDLRLLYLWSHFQVFSTGEIVYLSVILAMYCVGLVGSVIKMSLWFFMRGFVIYERLFGVVFVIFMFFLCMHFMVLVLAIAYF
jgi:hypothetical protein